MKIEKSNIRRDRERFSPEAERQTEEDLKELKGTTQYIYTNRTLSAHDTK